MDESVELSCRAFRALRVVLPAENWTWTMWPVKEHCAADQEKMSPD